MNVIFVRNRKQSYRRVGTCGFATITPSKLNSIDTYEIRYQRMQQLSGRSIRHVNSCRGNHRGCYGYESAADLHDMSAVNRLTTKLEAGMPGQYQNLGGHYVVVDHILILLLNFG